MAQKYSLGVRVSVTNTAKSIGDLQKLQQQLETFEKIKQKLSSAGAGQSAFNLNEDELKAVLSLLKQTQTQARATGNSLKGIDRSTSLNELGRAIKRVNQELALNPKNTGIAQQLSEIFKEGKNVFNISQRLQKAFNLDPTGANALASSIQKLRTNGEGARKAAELLKTALNLNDSDAAAVAVSLAKIGREANKSSKDADKLGQSLDTIIAGGLLSIGDSVVDSLKNAISELGEAITTFVSDALAANLQLKQIEGSLQAIFQQQGASVAESIRLSGEALEFVQTTAASTGQNFGVASRAYAQLSAAAQSSNLEQQELNRLFEETNRVFGIFGLSAERADLAFGAISQILGKNQLSLEELRQQLGESLPIALKTTADGLGVTVGELNKLVAAGEISGREFALAFTRGLEQVPGEINRTQAAINQLGSQLFFFSAAVGDALQPVQESVLTFASEVLTAAGNASNGFDPLIEAGERLRDVLAENPELALALGEYLAQLGDILVNLLSNGLAGIAEWLDTNSDEIVSFFGELGQVLDDISALTEGITNLSNQAKSFIEILPGGQAAAENFGNVFRAGPVSDALATLEFMAARLRNIVGLMERAGLIAPESFEGLGNSAEVSEEGIKQVSEALGGLQDSLNKAGSTEGGSLVDLDTDPLKEAVEALDNLTEANQSALNQIELDTLQSKATLLEAGGTQEEIAQLESEALQKRLAENQKYLSQLAAVNRSTLDKEGIEKLNQEILAVEQQIAQDRVQVVEAANDRIVESFKKLEQENKRIQLSRERSILQLEQSLRAAGASEVEIIEQTSEARFKAEQERIRQEIQLQRQRQQQTGEDTSLEVAELENELLETQIGRERELQDQAEARAKAAEQAAKEEERRIKELRDTEIEAIQEATELRQKQFDVQTAALAAIESSLQRQNDLISNQAELFQEIDNARLSIIDRDIADTNNARDLIRARDSGSLNRDQLSFVNSELADLGFGRRSGIDDVERQLLVLQQRRNEQEEFSLLRQQELARQTLEIEILRGKAAAERQIIESEIAVIQAEAALIEAQINGQTDLIPLLQRQLGLRQQQLATAKDLAAQEDENAQRQRDLLAIQQASERANLSANQANAARELANSVTDPNVRRSAERQADALEDESVAADQTVIAFANQLERSLELINTAEQRLALEQAITDAVNSRNESGSSVGVRASLRKGGPVEAGGLYQVHSDEFFVPAQNGTILSQQASRQVVYEAMTAGQLSSVNVAAPVVSTKIVSTNKIESQLAKLIELTAAKPPVVVPTTYNLETKSPTADMIKLNEARIRMLYTGLR